jgi:hypothetical protein
MIRKSCAVGALTLAMTCFGAVPAVAAPNPSPVAPEHTGTGCSNVLAHNAQTSVDTSHQATQGQENFFGVGAAFCGV